MSSMLISAAPLLYLNLGGEMIYILDQGLHVGDKTINYKCTDFSVNRELSEFLLGTEYWQYEVCSNFDRNNRDDAPGKSAQRIFQTQN